MSSIIRALYVALVAATTLGVSLPQPSSSSLPPPNQAHRSLIFPCSLGFELSVARLAGGFLRGGALRLRGGAEAAAGDDSTSDVSGFVSTIFLSGDSEGRGFDDALRQALPVSDIESKSIDRDFLGMAQDPNLPPLRDDAVPRTKALTGRQFLRMVRRETAAMNLTSEPAVKEVLVRRKKDGGTSIEESKPESTWRGEQEHGHVQASIDDDGCEGYVPGGLDGGEEGEGWGAWGKLSSDSDEEDEEAPKFSSRIKILPPIMDECASGNGDERRAGWEEEAAVRRRGQAGDEEDGEGWRGAVLDVDELLRAEDGPAQGRGGLMHGRVIDQGDKEEEDEEGDTSLGYTSRFEGSSRSSARRVKAPTVEEGFAQLRRDIQSTDIAPAFALPLLSEEAMWRGITGLKGPEAFVEPSVARLVAARECAWQLIGRMASWLGQEKDIDSARRLATWIFSLLAAAPAASSREEVASLDLLEEVCIQREGGAGVEELLDVVVSAVRVMRRGGVEGRASRKGKRRGPGLPPLEALHACRFEEGVSGGKCKISNGGRTVDITGEGTALVQPFGKRGGGKLWVCVQAERLGGKDTFVGVAEEGSAAGGKYLPEIGYALRGGCDRGRFKSTPQFTCGGGRVVDTGAFVRNFQEGELVWLILDEEAGTLEYSSADRYHGVVFRGLPKGSGRLQVAVSNGWQGKARFHLVGQLRAPPGGSWRDAVIDGGGREEATSGARTSS